MTARLATNGGPRMIGLTIDKDGHREYDVAYRVNVDPSTDGPLVAWFCRQIPSIGSAYFFKNEIDQWAWRTPEGSCKPATGTREGSPADTYDLVTKFSTKPPERCPSDGQKVDPVTGFTIRDPLLVPMVIEGGTTKYTEEATEDRFGEPIYNSAWERMRGPQVEFDKTRGWVRIKQNHSILDLAFVESLRDTLNQIPMWGFPKRTVKFSDFSWHKHFYGQTGSSVATGTGTSPCQTYFERVFTFDIRNDDVGFDKFIADEGSKVIIGDWKLVGGVYNYVVGSEQVPVPDPNNPTHFVRAKDRKGNYVRMLLNGAGYPAGLGAGTGEDTGLIYVAKYSESNFLTPRLGLPTDLEAP